MEPHDQADDRSPAGGPWGPGGRRRVGWLGIGPHDVAAAAVVAGVAAVAVVGAFAWWAVGLEPFSGTATAAVVAVGVLAIALGSLLRHRWAAGPTAARRPVPGGAGWWVAWVVALGAWQLAAYLQHPRDEHPTLSSLTNALLDSQPARAIAFVLWAVAALEVARR